MASSNQETTPGLKIHAQRFLDAINAFDNPENSAKLGQIFNTVPEGAKIAIQDLGNLHSREPNVKLAGISFEIKRGKKKKLSVRVTFLDDDGNSNRITYKLNGKKNTIVREITAGNTTLIMTGVRGTEPVPGYIRDVLRYFTEDNLIHDDTIHEILIDIGDALLRLRLMTLGAKYPEDWEDFKAEVLGEPRSLADLQRTIETTVAPYRQDVEHPGSPPKQAVDRIIQMPTSLKDQVNLN